MGAPYGMAGGMPGSKGLNSLVIKSGKVLNLGGKCSVPVKAGDMFRLQTPGGGGWGAEQSEQEDMDTGEVYVSNVLLTQPPPNTHWSLLFLNEFTVEDLLIASLRLFHGSTTLCEKKFLQF